MLLQMWPGGLGAGPGWSFMALAAWAATVSWPLARAQGAAGLCRQAGWAMVTALLVECRVGFPGGLLFVTVGCREAARGPLVPLPSLGGWRRLSPTQDWEYLRWGLTGVEEVRGAGPLSSFRDR